MLKESILAAYAVDMGEVQSFGNIGVLERDLDRLRTRLQSKGSRVIFVYEAGPCGYGLYRHLTKKGFACTVCAPSLIARKPADRVRTDRRQQPRAVTSPCCAADITGVISSIPTSIQHSRPTRVARPPLRLRVPQAVHKHVAAQSLHH